MPKRSLALRGLLAPLPDPSSGETQADTDTENPTDDKAP